MSRTPRPLLVPSQADIENYSGGHTHKKWRMLPETWHCPSCGRHKHQLLKWVRCRTAYGGQTPGTYKWLAILDEHHDHSVGYLTGLSPRFAATIICHDCNIADATAKKLLGLQADFSFSPDELSTFVVAIPHGSVTINKSAAIACLKRLNGGFR